MDITPSQSTNSCVDETPPLTRDKNVIELVTPFFLQSLLCVSYAGGQGEFQNTEVKRQA